MALLLTEAALRRMFPRAPDVYVAGLVAGQEHLRKAGILDTPQRLAYCFANVAHECNDFTIRNLTENINYTHERAAQIWPSRFSSAADVRARFGDGAGWQKRMFDSVYGNRMGNRPGTSDGSRYIGRGACQHTGRDGYAEMQRRTALPLVDDPELATRPEHQAALIAAFWSWKAMNGPADSGDFTAVVRRWNGGTIGMADRRLRLGRILPVAGALSNGVAPPALPVTPPKPRPRVTPEGGTAGGIGTGGAAIAVEAARQGASPETIIGILIATAVVAVAAYFIIRKVKGR